MLTLLIDPLSYSSNWQIFIYKKEKDHCRLLNMNDLKKEKKYTNQCDFKTNKNYKWFFSIKKCVLTKSKKTFLVKKSSLIQKNKIYSHKYNKIPKGSYIKPNYKVRSGDTLFYIAWITGKNYKDLARYNNITSPYNIRIGQQIYIRVKNKNSDLIHKTHKSSLREKKFFHRYINKQNNILLNSTINLWHWPTYGRIVKYFSILDNGNKGIDITGTLGQPIYAASKGRVVYIGNTLRGYGNLIIIKHSNDYLSAYAHNDRILVEKQQIVSFGQKIATMGSSGSNSVKLHFEIRYRGRSVNPLNYLPQK